MKKTKISRLLVSTFMLMFLWVLAPSTVMAVGINDVTNSVWEGTAYASYDSQTATQQIKYVTGAADDVVAEKYGGSDSGILGGCSGTMTITENGKTRQLEVDLVYAGTYDSTSYFNFYGLDDGYWVASTTSTTCINQLTCSYPIEGSKVWTLTKKGTGTTTTSVSVQNPITISTSMSSDESVYETTPYKAIFDESYFAAKNTKVQKGLAKLSAVAAYRTYQKGGVKQLLKACGFETKSIVGGDQGKFSKSGMKHSTKTDNDHASVYFGAKDLSDGTRLIAVVISGYSEGKYEWISNFNLGTGKYHSGFHQAASEVTKLVNKYIEKQANGKTVKVWITGHSRGAALTNMVAINLLDAKGSAKKVDKKNIYAYGFATPQYTTTKSSASKYNCMINYISTHDFVPYVAPSGKRWGYQRLGQNIYFTSDQVNVSDMKKYYKKYAGKNYRGMSAKECQKLVKAFAKLGISKEKYSKKVKHKLLKMKASDYAQKGIAYLMTDTGKASGVLTILKYLAEPDALYLTHFLVKDAGWATFNNITINKLNNNTIKAIAKGNNLKIGKKTVKIQDPVSILDSHEMSTYVCWVEALYK